MHDLLHDFATHIIDFLKGKNMETSFEFTLPRGYVDKNGEVHKKGKMRLATAGDELSAARDPRVLTNPAYLSVVVLSKVITEIEGVEAVTASMLENLFTADMAFLQDMYTKVNDIGELTIPAVCPHCGKQLDVPVNFTREG